MTLATTIVVMMLAIVVIAGVILRPAASERAAASAASGRDDLAWSAVEIRTNGRGEVLQVTGPDPRMVLRAFCEPSASSRVCRPVKITMTNPATASRRLGIFSDPHGSRLRAIEIVRGDRVQSWTAGDGLQPIAVMAAPKVSAEEAAIPVHDVR